METAIILIGVLVALTIGVVVLLIRRDRAAHRLPERYKSDVHHNDQSEARAAAHAAQMGRGGGFPL